MKYDIKYFDGGDAGPFNSFKEAYDYSVPRLYNGNERKLIEIRPFNSPSIGGYKSKTAGSFYLSIIDDKTTKLEILNGVGKMIEIKPEDIIEYGLDSNTFQVTIITNNGKITQYQVINKTMTLVHNEAENAYCKENGGIASLDKIIHFSITKIN